MKKIELTEELVASSARQGVTICGTEAEIVLGYVKAHGYELLADDDFKLYLHDESEGENHGSDSEQTIRDIVELFKELNEEMLMDSYSEESLDYDDQLELRKDTLILETVLERAQQIIPPTIRRYDVVIIEHRKKVVPTLAASWVEAEGRVRRCGRTARLSLSRETSPESPSVGEHRLRIDTGGGAAQVRFLPGRSIF